MKDKRILISIIVPAYNVESYIKQCILSLVHQNVSTDFYEIICVNDGSIDSTGLLLEELKNKHSNIIVVNQENQGVSAARNKGLDLARGDYIWFVDADDFIKENSLDRIVKLLNDSQCDSLSVLPFSFEDGQTIDYKQISAEMSQPEYRKFLWTKIIKKERVTSNSIYFESSISYAEDCVFMIQLNPHLVKNENLNEIVYYYRRRDNSLMSQQNEKKIRSRIESAKVCLEIIDEKRSGNKDEAEQFLYVFISKAMAMLSRLPVSKRREIVGYIKRENLFPLKYKKERTPNSVNDRQSMIKKIQHRLEDYSYIEFVYHLIVCLNFLKHMK